MSGDRNCPEYSGSAGRETAGEGRGKSWLSAEDVNRQRAGTGLSGAGSMGCRAWYYAEI